MKMNQAVEHFGASRIACLQLGLSLWNKTSVLTAASPNIAIQSWSRDFQETLSVIEIQPMTQLRRLFIDLDPGLFRRLEPSAMEALTKSSAAGPLSLFRMVKLRPVVVYSLISAAFLQNGWFPRSSNSFLGRLEQLSVSAGLGVRDPGMSFGRRYEPMIQQFDSYKATLSTTWWSRMPQTLQAMRHLALELQSTGFDEADLDFGINVSALESLVLRMLDSSEVAYSLPDMLRLLDVRYLNAFKNDWHQLVERTAAISCRDARVAPRSVRPCLS